MYSIFTSSILYLNISFFNKQPRKSFNVSEDAPEKETLTEKEHPKKGEIKILSIQDNLGNSKGCEVKVFPSRTLFQALLMVRFTSFTSLCWNILIVVLLFLRKWQVYFCLSLPGFMCLGPVRRTNEQSKLTERADISVTYLMKMIKTEHKSGTIDIHTFNLSYYI